MSALRRRFPDATSAAIELPLCLLALTAVEIEICLSTQREGPLVANIAVLAGMTLACLWRSQPLAAYAVFAGFGVILSAFLTPIPHVTTALPVLMLSTLLVAARSDRNGAWAAMAIGAVFIGVVNAVYSGSAFSDYVFPFLFFVVLPWGGGRLTRERVLLGRELRETNRRLEALAGERADRAVSEERRRIAHELHDVVAHDVSMAVIQAEGARRVLETDPDQAKRSAALIEGIGREALTEMRRLLGVLRRGDEELALAPQPTITRVDALVARAREAGLQVELRVDGEPRTLGRGADLVAYRVVQEALTNTIRHAGPARATVIVDHNNAGIDLMVLDTGRGPDSRLVERQGLIGLRERVAVYGGSLEVGRRRSGGFRLSAHVPTAKGATA